MNREDKQQAANKLRELKDLLPGHEGKWSADSNFYHEWSDVLMNASRLLTRTEQSDKLQDVKILINWSEQTLQEEIDDLTADGYVLESIIPMQTRFAVAMVKNLSDGDK